MFFLSRYWLRAIPVDVYTADMLPIMKVMDRRFLSGEWNHVYDTIPEIWQGIRPIYLPAMWMPFAIPTLLNLDVRWLTVVCLLFAFTVFFHILHFRRHEAFAVFLSFIAAMLFWWLMTQNDLHGFVSVSEEGVVVAYYVILVWSLLSGNIVLTGIAASLCLLSRYSLIGWVPAFALYLLLSKKYRNGIIFATIGLGMLLVLFIIPFGWQPFMRLIHLPEYYIDFAGKVWKSSPEVFANSMGFAKFFGPKGTTILHRLLVVLAFSVPLLFIAGVYYLKKKGRMLNNVPLATLKVSLVIFYSFLDVPYLYLFYTSSFVSLVAVCFFVAGHHVHEPET